MKCIKDRRRLQIVQADILNLIQDMLDADNAAHNCENDGQF